MEGARSQHCRSSKNLDIHHIIHREHGGTNDPSNLLLLCEGHHLLAHAGSLAPIAGTKATDPIVSRRAGSSFAAVTRVVETTRRSRRWVIRSARREGSPKRRVPTWVRPTGRSKRGSNTPCRSVRAGERCANGQLGDDLAPREQFVPSCHARRGTTKARTTLGTRSAMR